MTILFCILGSNPYIRSPPIVGYEQQKMAALLGDTLQWLSHQQQTLLTHPSFYFPVLLFTVFILLILTKYLMGKSLNLPPSPPKLPIIGHLRALGSLPHRSLRDLSEKHGPLMLIYLGYTPALVVSSAEVAKEVLKTHDVIFSDRPISTATKQFHYGGNDLAFAPVSSDYWRQLRKICVIDLLSVKRVQSFRFVRDEESANLVSKIKQASLMGKNVNLSELIAGVTINVISRLALGRSLDGVDGKSEYVELTKNVMELLGIFCMADMFPALGWVDVLTGHRKKVKMTTEGIHAFFDEVINDHMVSKQVVEADRTDLVDILLEHVKDPTILGFQFTRKDLRAVILNMFVAGADTTYAALEWTMAELVNNQNVIKKLQEEVRRVVGDKATVDENDINQMEYLNCVIKETLRLHPPLALSAPRESTAVTEVQGYHIPARTRVLINVWAIARDPKVWDRPDEFIPERFMNNPIDFRGKDFNYIPFGAGRRACPGISFAIASVESVLANLLYWFDWEPANKMGLDMSEGFGLTVPLKNPLVLTPVLHFA